MEVDKIEKQLTYLFSHLGKLRSLPLKDILQPSLTVMQKPATTEPFLQLQCSSKYRPIFQSTQSSSFSVP
eukprot:7649916-Ditylum_brightwellii.AAC.1